MSRTIVVCLLAVALAACRTPAPEPQAVVLAAIRSAPSPERIHTINEAVFRHRGDAASLMPLLSERDPHVRWGAAYAAALWADDAGDVEALAPHLGDSDEAIRVMIAGSLAGLGHAGARATLSSLSASGTPMPFSDPPLTVGRFAIDALAALDATGGAR
jgi:hypothetical protein